MSCLEGRGGTTRRFWRLARLVGLKHLLRRVIGSYFIESADVAMDCRGDCLVDIIVGPKYLTGTWTDALNAHTSLDRATSLVAEKCSGAHKPVS